MKKVQRFKKVITSILLLIALLTVQVMQVAAETDQNDTPSVVCSDYSSLYQAFIQANDGDVIGIDNIIDIQAEGGTFGSSDKHVTIVKVNDGAMIQVSTRTPFTFKNITFDGKDITSYNSMINVGFNTNFEDVTFQNCKCVFDGCGGAVTITGGTVNLTGCIFLNNTSQSGGHLYVMNDSQVTITGCTFEGGNGVKGGAINQDGSSSYVTINSTTIKGNDASESGGGIYSQGRMVIEDSKVYDNTAPLGEDITCTVLGNVQVQDDVDALQQLFDGENITVKGWILTIDENNASKYRKFDYEVITEPDPGDDEETGDPDDGGNGDQGDSGDQGNTDDPSQPGDDSGNTGGSDQGGTGDSGIGDDQGNDAPSDPGDSGSETDEGNTDGQTPSDSGDTGSSDNKPGDSSGNDDAGGTDAGGNNSTDNSNNSTNDSSSTDNSDHSTTDNSSQDSTDNSSHDTITDSSDHSTTTTNTSTDNSQTTSNSGNSTTTTTTDSSNNSRTDNSRTESSDNHSTTTTTTNNYYQTEKSKGQQTPVQSQQPVIINNYIEPSQDGQKASQGQQMDNSSPSSESPSNDPSNNIRIDANGVDMTFEVVDGVYSISINASQPVQAAEPALSSAPVQAVTEASEQKNSVNWYEIIKIVLLAALVVNMLWKPKMKHAYSQSTE